MIHVFEANLDRHFCLTVFDPNKALEALSILKYQHTFGMPIQDRYFSSSNYRYAYNGMEADNEISGPGNSYTTEFRQYDPRLGRWKSLDPLMAKFPWMSPYVAFNNNPIYFVDPFGLEGTPEEQANEALGVYLGGKNPKRGKIKYRINKKDGSVKFRYRTQEGDRVKGTIHNAIDGAGATASKDNIDHIIPQSKGTYDDLDAIDREIFRRGINSFKPTLQQLPDHAFDWEKDLAQSNYELYTERWNKSSLASKWQKARQNLVLNGVREASVEMVEPVAKLYEIQATLGGTFPSGVSSGVGATASRKVIGSFDDIVEMASSWSRLKGGKRKAVIEGANAARVYRDLKSSGYQVVEQNANVIKLQKGDDIIRFRKSTSGDYQGFDTFTRGNESILFK